MKRCSAVSYASCTAPPRHLRLHRPSPAPIAIDCARLRADRVVMRLLLRLVRIEMGSSWACPAMRRVVFGLCDLRFDCFIFAPWLDRSPGSSRQCGGTLCQASPVSPLTWVNDPSTGQRSRRADSHSLAKKVRHRASRNFSGGNSSRCSTRCRRWRRRSLSRCQAHCRTGLDDSRKMDWPSPSAARPGKVAKMSSTVGASSIPRNIFSDVSRVILRHSTSGTTGRLVLK